MRQSLSIFAFLNGVKFHLKNITINSLTKLNIFLFINQKEKNIYPKLNFYKPDQYSIPCVLFL